MIVVQQGQVRELSLFRKFHYLCLSLSLSPPPLLPPPGPPRPSSGKSCINSRFCFNSSAVPFSQHAYECADIHALIDFALQNGDVQKWSRFQQLRASVEGRYDFAWANLNDMVNQTVGVEVRPIRFRDWIWRSCADAQLQS